MDNKCRKTILVLTLVIFGVLGLVKSSLATIYYVDFESGLDTNTGTSTSAPFKHCPGDGNAADIAKATSLTGGDRVIFKGGVQYTGTSDALINVKWSGSGDADSQRIIYDGDSGTYAPRWGSGKDKAIIDGSKTVKWFFMIMAPYVTINNFEMRNGRYVYSGSAGVQAGGGMFIDNEYGYDYITVSNCYMHNPGVADYSIFYSGLNGDPPCNEAGNCPNGCDYASGICVYSLLGNHINVHDNIMTDCGKVGVLMSNGNYMKLYNNTITGRITYPIWYQIGEGSTTAFTDSEVHDNIIYDHVKGLTAADCRVSGQTCPICTGDGHGNWIFFGAAPNWNGTWKNTRIYNNKIYNAYNVGYDPGHSAGLIQYAAEATQCFDGFYFYNNVMFNQEALGPDIYTRKYGSAPNEGCIKNVYVVNNAYYGTNPNVNSFVFGDGAGDPAHWVNMTIKNNIIYNTGQYVIRVPYQAYMSGTIDIDYNNYYGTYDTGRIFAEDNWATNTHTLLYWNTGSPNWRGLGYDAHGYGPTSDPLFVNTTIGPNFDLRLSSTASPAYQTGDNLYSLCSNPNLAKLCYDIDSNPRPASGSWDIGAYQYQPPQTCSQLSGTCCSSGQTCSGSFQPSSDCGSLCCVGTCQTPVCGDGSCDGAETCSTCPADCACTSGICCSGACITPACTQSSDCGSNPCMTYTCSNPGTCSASCSSIPKTSCVNGDSCCPAGCTNYTDSDCPAITPGLVLGYHFDEGSGLTASDFSGNVNTGTISGAAWTAGKSGGGLSFDGASSYVNAGSATSLDDIENQGGGGMTVSAWIYNRADPQAGYPNVIMGKSPSGAGYWQFMVFNGYRLGFGKDYATNDLNALSAANSYSLNAWHHVAVTWTGNPASSTDVKFYVDGSLKGHSYDQDGTSVKVSDSALNLYISRDNWGAGAYFNGTIDEVRIYNRVLSPQEISSLYSQTSCIHKSDTNCDNCISSTELSAFIGLWHVDSSNPTIRELMEAIGLWKSGGC